nr:NADH dehydrogenase subunit 5 [Travisia sanrikuensis]
MPLLSSSILASQFLWILFPMMSMTALYLSLLKLSILLQWEITLLNSTPIFFPIILDPISTTFSATVIFISANVIYFSNFYMTNDQFQQRFTHLVLLFVLSMNMLLFFPHLMTLLLGWDGLGLTSFILVIYYQNAKSLAAGMITALTNRIGDVLLLISIAISLNQGHWSIIHMWNSNSTLFSILTFSIILAAMTKSAQMPFSSWLPAAMAAPTPVSALVHSSTLVTAGIFLLIRFFPYLQSFTWFCPLLLLSASLTMFMAGLSALMECDLKKIIALSTLSQLGVMMASLGLSMPLLALFHLLTHALFKALLFLCAGTLISFHHHGQDIRSMGNLTSQLPITMSSLLLANLALCGFPFMAGFYSKDMILEHSLWMPTNYIILILLFLSTALTAAYSIRLLITVILSPTSSSPLQYTKEAIKEISIPTLMLSFGAITSGSFFNWMFTNPFIHPILPPALKLSAFMVTTLGGIIAFFLYSFLNSSSSSLINFQSTHHASSTMWFLSPLSSQAMMPIPFSFAHLTIKNCDQGWLEKLSGQGMNMSFASFSSNIQSFNSLSITSILNLSFLLTLPMILSFFCLSS